MARFKYNGRKSQAYERSLPDRGNRTVEKAGRLAERSAKERAAVDTGEMRDKIHFEIDGAGQGTLRADADHSGFVEFGTYKMAAQPYFVPALEEARQAFPGVAVEVFRP